MAVSRSGTKGLQSYRDSDKLRVMRKSDAVSLYGSQSKLGEALGVAQSTIGGWGEVVPLPWAVILERAHRRRLRVDLSLYEKVPPCLRGHQ